MKTQQTSRRSPRTQQKSRGSRRTRNRAEYHLEQFLALVGYDADPDTLRRHTKFWMTFLREGTVPPDVRTFPLSEIRLGDDLKIGPITFVSMCEHHLLPFFGTVEISISHGDYKVLGLSKYVRGVRFIASRPQVQERMTIQIREWVESYVGPRAIVTVTSEARHLCMMARGVRESDSTTTFSTTGGIVEDSHEASTS